jgi:hypothetical protein
LDALISARLLREQYGTFIAGLGRWDYFGGLTYDQRRQRPRWAADDRPIVHGGQLAAIRRVVLHPSFGSKPLRVAPIAAVGADGAGNPAVRLGQDMRPGRDSAIGRVEWFLREGQRQLGRKIEAAVVALEYQKNGWPHFHPLLRLEGGVQDGDLRTLGPIWYQVAGYARLEVPRVRDEVCAYAAKYLSKGLDRGDVVFWPSAGDLREVAA